MQSRLLMEPDISDYSIERMERTRAKPWCLILTFIGVLITIACGGIMVFWFAHGHGLNVGLSALQQIQPPKEEALPDKWMISEKYIIPYFNTTSEGSTITSYLESVYKYEGISRGILGKDQQVLFSQKAISQLISSYCDAHKTSRHCSNGLDEMIFWTDEINKHFVIPKSATGKSVRQNCINFNITNIDMTIGMSSTKAKLLFSEKPLILALPKLKQRLWLETSDDSLFRCPYNYSKHCIPILSDLGTELSESKMSETFADDRNWLLLVGYNNDIMSGKHEGGFIVKNNWGAVGHTLSYLMKQIPAEIDKRLCPDRNDAFQWIPASIECLMSNSEKCSEDISRRFGDVITGAMELKCINSTFCKEHAKYFLLRDNSSTAAMVDSLGRPYVAEIVDGSITKKVMPLPMKFVWMALTPVEFPSAMEKYCGYVVLPYDLLKNVAGMKYRGRLGWRVFDMELAWSSDSFSLDSNDCDSHFLKESLETVDLGLAEYWRYLEEL